MSKVTPNLAGRTNVVPMEHDTIKLEFAAYLAGDAWTDFEYIGTRDALQGIVGVDAAMFEVGKSGVRQLQDQFGDFWRIQRYANDVWRLTSDVFDEVKYGPRGGRIDTFLERVDVGPLLERFRRPPAKA